MFIAAPKRPEVYTYEDKCSAYLERVIRKDRPDGRSLQIEYHKTKGFEEGKVKCLKAPAGKDATPVPIYTFDYQTQGNYKKRRGMAQTVVWDALDHQTIYEYFMDDYRLRSVKRYKGTDPYTLYSEEKMFWGAPDTPNDSHLISRTLQDEKGQIAFCRHYVYDELGNILEDQLYGNLSGKSSQPVVMKNKVPLDNGAEKYTKSYTYSNDLFNLVTSAKEPGIETQFRYHPGTDLLQAKYVIFNGSIQMREFYEYDARAAVTFYCRDNGCKEKVDDLTGVTERQVKKIENNKFGLPLCMEEFYLQGNQLVLLKKSVNHYDPLLQLIQQDHYDANGAFAYSLFWEYDPQGHVIKETNALGHVICRTYDANGNLLSEQGPRPDQLTRFTYDRMNRKISEEVILPSGKSLKTNHSYDLQGNKIATTDIYGNETRYEVDSVGRVNKIHLPAIENEKAQWICPSESYVHDLLGHPCSITDPKGNVTTVRYTILGKPYFKKYPEGSTETYEYSLKGELLKSTDAQGTTAVYTYDSLSRPLECSIYDSKGQCLRKTSKKYNAFHLISETNAQGITTAYSYDAAGRLVQQETAGQKTLYFYDAMGRESEVHEYFSATDCIIKIKKYDPLNRVIEEYVQDKTRRCQGKVHYSYDEMGQQTEVKTFNIAGESSHYSEYNVFKEPTLILDALGHATQFSYDYHFAYRNGRIGAYTSSTDPLGCKSIQVYDTHHRPIQSQRLSAKGNLVQKQEQAYDLKGNLIKSTQYVLGRKAEPIITTYEYDSRNRLVSTTEAVGTPEQKRTQRVYYPSGQLKQWIKADTSALNYTYDPLSRLTLLTSSDQKLSYRYSYNDQDQPVLVEDLTRHLINQREYNKQGCLTRELLGNGLEMRMDYDLLGRITSVTYPDQSAVKYTYWSKYLSEVNRYSPEGKKLYSQTYLLYDFSGNPLKVQKPGVCGQVQYHYDLLNRLTAQEGLSWKEHFLEYDAGGRLLSRTLEDPTGVWPCKYAYDDTNQLISETGIAQHQFVNDSLYNQIVKDGTNQKFNALHQLLQSPDAVEEYDRNGNLIAKKGNVQVTYGYDPLDRLAWIIQGQRQINYIYDSDNRRLYKRYFTWDSAQSKWIKDEEHRYLYIGKNEVGTVDATGKIIELRILGLSQGAEVGGALVIEKGDQAYVPLHDHQGNVAVLLDLHTAQPQEVYHYSAFGIEQLYDAKGNSLSDPLSPWRFSSKRYDPESGFIYFGERYYDPWTSRWITQDPLDTVDGPNLYAYVQNNPIVYIDPTGLYFLIPPMEGFMNDLANGKMDLWRNKELERDQELTGMEPYGDIRLSLADHFELMISDFTEMIENPVLGLSKMSQGIHYAFLGDACDGIPEGLTIGIMPAPPLGVLGSLAKELPIVGKWMSRFRTTAPSMAPESLPLIQFTPKLLTGNKDFGLRHIMKRHSYNSTSNNVSRFNANLDENKISDLIKEGVKKARSWEIATNKFSATTVDLQRPIGFTRNNEPTSLIKIVVDQQGVVRTAYPCENL